MSNPTTLPVVEHPLTVEVVLPVPLSQSFTYSVPVEWESSAREGFRVLVPFGNRHLQGVIVRRNEAKPDRKQLKELSEILDKAPSLSSEMLSFTRWIADYYACSWGEAIRATLPAGIETGRLFIIHDGKNTIPDGADKKTLTISAILKERGPIPLPELRKAVGGIPQPQLDYLDEIGVLKIEILKKAPKIKASYLEEVFLKLEEHINVDVRGSKQQKILEVLRDHAPDSLDIKTLLYQASASRASLNSLIKKKLIGIKKTELVRTPVGPLKDVSSSTLLPPLYPDQQKALDTVCSSLEKEHFETFLLQGVTGSGKTRVYIEVLKKVVEKGKSAIVLVPEIALTPQTVRRFQKHFGDQIAVLHSRMSPGERFDSWRLLKNGTYRIVIGPRSAVLAPVKNLGLIVVDEEHETSYKQYDPAPRYHARDAAVMRASINKAICILGSATPSLESYVNAHELCKYTLLNLPERVPLPDGTKASLPSIRLVNMSVTRHRIKKGWALSDLLIDAIQQRLLKKEQVILLQNRRGYAPVQECQECGWTPECKDCSITLTYHKTKRHMRCHYCGRVEKPAQRCQHCQSAEIEFLGIGTQRVEEELEARIPEARVLRMDMDTTSRKHALNRILDAFGNLEADILLGTQMVAKGLHFERVSLVGVINADAGLMPSRFSNR